MNKNSKLKNLDKKNKIIKVNKNPIIYFLSLIIIVSFGFLTIKEDYLDVLKTYITLFIFGISIFPSIYKISKNFEEKGYFISKSIGLSFITFLIYTLGTLKILKFTNINILIIVSLIAIINYSLIFPKIKKDITKKEIIYFIFEEILFLGLLTIFTYIRGFKPEIEQTEKYMDYGIIKSIYKTDYFPIEDMWFSNKNLNYYYFGQVILTTILKTLNVPTETGYNICISIIITLSSINLGTIIFNIAKKYKNSNIKSLLLGTITSIITFFTASCHYLYYGIIKYIWDKSYIVYDSTRYIGYNPDTNDKTIHEFPLYGFLLGDAHAYTINTIFVITILFFAFLYYFKEYKNLKNKLLSSEIIIMGFLIGIFKMTNFWDFPIYLVVCGCILLISNIKETIFISKNIFKNCYKGIFITIIQIFEMFIFSTIVALPFTKNFEMIASQIKITNNHTPLYQLFVLWGFFIILFIIFIIKTLKDFKNKQIKTFDILFILLGLCGLGLVLLPELIYVKDIYVKIYTRANTMFKLTYQAYILLSISSSYYIYKLINEKNKIYKILAILACLILAINSTYIERYLSKDFGNIFNYDEYKGIDGTKYLIRRAPNEYEAITFINDNFKDRHKFLEASTDSYSEGNKISSFTGNITIYGWKTHESLWNNYQEKDERNLAIAKIYTSGDKKEIIKELKKYKIEYIVIGPYERTEYKNINDKLLESLGYKIFENNSVKIIKLNI